MLSLPKHVRWAVILPLFQLAIFIGVGLQEHRKYLTIQRRRTHSVSKWEWFGCTPLQRVRLSQEDRESLRDVDCWASLPVKVVEVSNLPVFVISLAVAELTSNREVDQVPLFYGINSIGIPLFWYFIGSLIDRRRRKRRLAHSPQRG